MSEAMSEMSPVQCEGIPSQWRFASVRAVTKRVAKIDPISLGRPTFRYVDIGSINSEVNSVDSPQEIRVDLAPTRARQALESGDTVFSTVRPYLRNIAWIPDALHGEIASTGFCILRPDRHQILPRFLLMYAISDHLAEQVLPLQRGVSYPAVLDKDVLGASLPVPPLPEQQRIVEILDDQLSRLDAALESVRIVRLKAAQFRRSLLHAAFTGALTGLDTANGFVPDGWRTSRLSELGVWVTGRTPPTVEPENFGTALPFVGPSDIGHGNRFKSAKRGLSVIGESKARVISPPSILVVCIGATLGKVSLSRQRVATNQQINALEVDTTIVDPRWVCHLLASPLIQRTLWQRSSSTTVPIINKKSLTGIEVMLPPMDYQVEIAEVIDSGLARVDAILEALDSIEHRANGLRRSLLHAAFTGKLTEQWREEHAHV
jgi:type I restriction enzyme S subunit